MAFLAIYRADIAVIHHWYFKASMDNIDSFLGEDYINYEHYSNDG
jgi:hypothetical protein